MKSPATSLPRLMVVDTHFAPCLGGSAVLMANLLSSYQGEVFAAVQAHNPADEDPNFQPPCPVYRLWVPWERVSCRLFSPHRDKALFVYLMRRFMRRLVKKHRPTAIMAAAPSMGMFVAAYEVASSAGIPFYAHMHDLWEENCPPGSDGLKLASRWEKPILTGARRVLCMTSVQADYYRDKYGIEPQLLPHTIPTATLASAPSAMTPPTLAQPTVLCVGTLSGPMNTDAMRVFARAAELLPQNVQCLVLSRTGERDWAAAGATSPRVTIRSATRDEVATRVSACHVLLVPLSHKNCSPNEVRTVLSTKLLEYFVSGRPILVFGPADCFHVRSATEGQWGYVVDRDDPRELAQGIVKLLGDQSLCGKLVAGALAEARQRDSKVYADQLYEWVVEDAGAGPRPEKKRTP